LIDSVTPIWKRIIKGDDAENNFPAKSFFEEIIPTDLKQSITAHTAETINPNKDTVFSLFFNIL